MTLSLDVKKIEHIVGSENILTDTVDLVVYSSDATPIKSRPNIVIFPTTTQQVSDIMKYASANRIPVVPRGAGSSLSGGPVAIKGGIILDFTKMNKILNVDTDNFEVLVEPGVVYKTLEKKLKPLGLFFPPDPSSQDWCTIGGMIAENAGGMRAVKYGVTRDWVMGLEVVLSNGDVAWFGSSTYKFASGYEMHRLIVGSEGTLAIITKALLKVTTLPEARLTAIAYFKTLEDAGKCVYETIRRGLQPSGAEIMDRLTMDAVSKFTGIKFPECGAVVVNELDGDQDSVKKRLKILEEIYKHNNAISYAIAKDEHEAEKIFESRHAAYSALSTYKPTTELEDVTVPISKVPEMFKRIEEISKKYGIMIATFGHMGDGNLHPNILYDEKIPEEKEKAELVKEEIFRAALDLKGTITGEHGVGCTKIKFFGIEHSSCSVNAQKAVKKALDPYNILNPGKIFGEM
ncbi:MAG: FAD-binding protein [Candidatus Odinarchaeum yellowstonii]|uniref:FAD-binding protein n=1 Tax=Odinarchaeota yellowstonii (strain LCB_4) TaxID=1841599 RepID=A0AAF0D1M9_ODILC|nr:MAG: FAD-binding protein [Candidatus Odinarchaeum yellowstonii]